MAVLSFVLAEVGAVGGNNLVIGIAAVGIGLLVVAWVAGRRNLRGLSLGWQLPEELFAGQAARGAFVVRNARSAEAVDVVVTDGCASAQGTVKPGEGTLATWWRPERRGILHLDGLSVRSTYPFGLFTHRLQQAGQASCLVYPSPVHDPAWAGAEGSGDGDQGSERGGCGELLDLRRYRPGDRLGALHWRTSARFGQWMVVDRAREQQSGVRVRVDDDELEAGLQAATGAIVEATRSGAPVCLELSGHPELAVFKTGTRWRRQLLDVLATR